jgi:CHAT domain-containing protein
LALVFVLACSSLSPQFAFDRANQAFLRGDLSAAEREAAKGYRDFHRCGADWAWKFKILEANTLMWRGLGDRVPSLLSSEPSSPPSGDLAVHRCRLEALALVHQHRFQEAESKLREAESPCASSHYPACAEVISAWGGLEMERGNFVQAQHRFEQALPLFRDAGDKFLEANALSSIGWSALQQEHFDEALDWASKSYQQATAIGARAVVQTALGNLGWAHYRLGEHEKALSMFLEAQSRAHESGIPTDELGWLTTAGYVYLDSGDFAKAEQSYLQAYEMAQHTTQQDVIDALVSLALVSERTGKLEPARDYADKAIALAPKDGDRLNVLYPMLVKGHVAARMQDTQQAEKIYREIEQDPKSHVYLKWEAEHSLAQLYEDESNPGAAEREYRVALNTFEGARYSLHEDTSLPFPANAAGIYDDYIHFLISKGRTNDALQIAEYQRGRTLAEGLGVLQKGTTFKPDALNTQAIARKAGGAILFYWLGEKQSYLWAVTPQRTTIFTLPPKSEIEPIAQRYRTALSEQQEFLQRTNDDGRALYGKLVEPAANLLPHNAKVFIIPDGALNTLNFETLLVPGSSPHYWIEDVTISDASSLRLLAASRTSPKSTDNVLLFGNAVAPNSDYPELRKAGAEMESIEKHFEPKHQEVFARQQATPAAYLTSKPERYSYIHFVAHGTASRMSPLDSAIVLSRSNAQEDSFKLYARDIIRHPLRAQLVTISTCYGAGARAYSGEGLVGLSWAFLRAGAHNVIGALWEVSDISTPQLMDELYRELETGQAPDTALRNAKLTLLRSNAPYRKPFYWAAFQLYTGS